MILITGSTGLIGSVASEYFLLKGKKIFNELQSIKVRRYKKLSEDLTNEEITNFNLLLDKMLLNSEKNLVK